jgi:hypothetical protein
MGIVGGNPVKSSDYNWRFDEPGATTAARLRDQIARVLKACEAGDDEVGRELGKMAALIESPELSGIPEHDQEQLRGLLRSAQASIEGKPLDWESCKAAVVALFHFLWE